MGLIQAAKETISKMLGDQWTEYYYCDSMPANVLVTRGTKRVSSGSSNKKGADNIISNGSVIAINEGQCMMIVEQGAIVEFSAQAGEFIWDASTEPSIFYGKLGENLKSSWEVLKRRFRSGGDTAKDQRIYYFNLKEIMDNKYGTPTPVPFRVVDHNIGLDVDISVRCNGLYSYTISDPMLFYKNVCGNVDSDYTRDRLDAQLKSEFLTALQPAFARISAKGIRYSALPGHTVELAEAMNEALSSKWAESRGIKVASVAVNSVAASAEDEAMKSAAKNENGAMMGFMGMNMAQTAGGMNANALFQMGQQQTAAPAAPISDSWECACGAVNSGKFCTECGASKPSDGWTCACGSVNKGKFCPECGAKKPAGEPLYKCDKCGWEPEDPKHPPHFCPECGDRFDSGDIQ